MFQVDEPVREGRGERAEVRSFSGLLRVDVVDGEYLQEAEIFFIAFWRSALPDNHIAIAQAKTANLRWGNIDIGMVGQHRVLSEKTVAITHGLQDTLAEHVTFLFNL